MNFARVLYIQDINYRRSCESDGTVRSTGVDADFDGSRLILNSSEADDFGTVEEIGDDGLADVADLALVVEMDVAEQRWGHLGVESFELERGVGGLVDFARETLVLAGDLLQDGEIGARSEGQAENGHLPVAVGLLDVVEDSVCGSLAFGGLAVGQENHDGRALDARFQRLGVVQGQDQSVVDVGAAAGLHLVHEAFGSRYRQFGDGISENVVVVADGLRRFAHFGNGLRRGDTVIVVMVLNGLVFLR